MGAPREDISGDVDAGAVGVLYGRGAGLAAAGGQLWHLDVAGVQGTAGAGALFGAALAWGDFDRDGFDDLAVGAFGAQVPVGPGTVRAGAVHVLHGSPAGLTAAGDQWWHQGLSSLPGGARAEDRFGEALAAGDFDGDGFDDLAVGIGRKDVTASGRTFTDAGAILVLPGSATGLRAAGAAQWRQGSGIQGTLEDGDGFGEALVVADFDGDGFADLAVGVVDEAVGGRTAAGAVNVLYGSAGGLTEERDQLWHEDVPGVAGAAEAGDHFGSSLGAGDFDGDGRADLVVGVPREGLGAGLERAGAVHVLPGSPRGVTADASRLWTQESPGVADRAEEDDRFGRALASGDFDGDGFDDLAISASREDVEPAGAADAGATHVLRGSPSGLSASMDQLWTQDTPGVLGAAEPGDMFGHALIAADYDGDGRSDLAIGVPGDDVGGAEDAGTVAVVYGSAAGLTPARDQLWHQDRPGVADHAETHDGYGEVVASP